MHRPTGPDKNVLDLLPLAGDTLIAAKFGGYALTTDAGKHWQEYDPKYWFIKHLTIDEHHVLWGLDSWPGIHEAPYSRMVYSQDFGKTWKRREYDTSTLFPYEFYSLPGQALQILTFRGKVYQIKDREGKQWGLVKSITEIENGLAGDTIPGDSYFSAARFKFLETGQLFFKRNTKWIPIVTVNFINQLDDVCACAGSTYLIGYNRTISPTPHYLLRASKGKIRDTIILPREEYQNLRCDKKGRIWLYNFRGVWQKYGNKLLKRY